MLVSNLALIGYRAVGKTTLGRRLAQKHQIPFIDLDEELEKILGPISLFWLHSGEPAFRLQETQLLEKLLPTLRQSSGTTLQQTLFACGGGVPLLQKNRDLLKNWGKVVWLKRAPEQILQHLQQQPFRPKLTEQSLADEVFSTLKARTPYYQESADIEIDLPGISIEGDLKVIETALSTYFIPEDVREFDTTE